MLFTTLVNGHFPGVFDSLVGEFFWGQAIQPQNLGKFKNSQSEPQFYWFLEIKSVNNMPSEEALPPYLRYAQESLEGVVQRR